MTRNSDSGRVPLLGSQSETVVKQWPPRLAELVVPLIPLLAPRTYSGYAQPALPRFSRLLGTTKRPRPSLYRFGPAPSSELAGVLGLRPRVFRGCGPWGRRSPGGA